MTATLPSTTLDDLAAYISGTGQRNRKSQLPYSSIDDGALKLKTGGTLSGYVGTQHDGTTGVVVVNGPKPPRPSAPTLSTSLGGLTARWHGTWDPVVWTGPNGADTPVYAPEDFKGIEVQVSADPDFEDGDAFDNVRGPLMTSARGGDIFVPWPEGNQHVYVRLVVRTLAGRVSDPSPVAEVTTGAVQADLSADGIAPQKITGLELSSFTAPDATGIDQGYIAAGWDEPTANADGTPLTDLSHFLVNWKWVERTGVLWEATSVADPGAILRAATGLDYQVRVAGVDRSGNVGAWSDLAQVTVAVDTIPPLPPQAPEVTNYMGQLRIFWSGLMEDLSDPPPDFARVEVHVGTTSNFTPVQGTRVSSLVAGSAAFATAPYAQTRYVRLYAFDHNGNRSQSSVVVAGTTSKVVADDIFTGAVGHEQLAALAVRTANINLLAVNSAQVGELTVGKLTGGTLSAEVVLGAGRLTTALTGARTEMNTLGFQKFRPNGSKAISLTDTESLLTGIIQTDVAPNRRIIMGAAGTAGEINFYAPDNRRAFIKAYTEPDARQIESIQIGMDQGGHYLWNRININDLEEIRMDGHQINLHFLNEDKPWGAKGEFTVKQYDGRANFSTNRIDRLVINNTGLVYRAPNNAERFNLYNDATLFRNPDGQNRLFLAADATYIHRSDGRIWLEQITGNITRLHPSGHGVGEGWIEVIHNAGNGLSSPRMLFVQGNFASTLLKAWDNGLEVRNSGDSAWHSIRALDHPVMSDARLKTDIHDAQLDGAAAVKAMRVRSYKSRRPRPGTVDETDEVEQIGLVAQEARDAGIPIVAAPGSDGMLSVSTYEYCTVLAKALQEALVRIEALERKRP